MAELSLLISRICLLGAPFAFWTGETLFTPIFDGLCLLAGATVLLSRGSNRHESVVVSLGPYVLLALLLIFQLIWLPPEWLKAISPTTWQAYAETIWQIMPGVWMPISVYSEQTLQSLFHVFALGGLALSLSHLLLNQRSMQILQTLKIALCLWATVSLLCSLSLFLPESSITYQITTLAGVNLTSIREVLQIWMIAILPLAISVYATLRPRVARLPIGAQLRDYFHAPAAFPHLNAAMAISLVLLAVIAASIPGFLIASLGGWCFYRYCKTGHDHLQKFVLMAGIFTCYAVLLIWHDDLLTPLWAAVSSRVPVVEAAVPWHFTWLGFGLGAHSDSLVSFGETGKECCSGVKELWIGLGSGLTLLFLLTVMSLFWTSRKMSSRLSNDLTKNLSYAGMTCCSLFLLFGFISNALGWESLLAGVMIGLTFSTWPVQIRVATFVRKDAPNIWPRFMIAVILCLIMLSGGLFFGSTHYASQKVKDYTLARNNIVPGIDPDVLYLSMRETGKWAPFDIETQLAQGYLRFDQKHDIQASKHFQSAMIRRPLYPETIVATATVYELLGHQDIAGRLLRTPAASTLMPNRTTERLLVRLLENSENSFTVDFLRLIFNRDPEHAGQYIGIMLMSGWEFDKILNILPENPLIFLTFGDVALTADERYLAEDAYLRATRMTGHDMVEPYLHVARYYLDAGQLNKALAIASTGLELFPENSAVRRFVANLHGRMGHDSRSSAEHAKAGLFEAN